MVLNNRIFLKLYQRNLGPHQCEFIEGFSEDLMPRIEKSNDRGSLCIFDEVMNEVSTINKWPHKTDAQKTI